jgi:hypothetical protein
MLYAVATFLYAGIRDLVCAGHSALCVLVPQWGSSESWSPYWCVLFVYLLLHLAVAFACAFKSRRLAYDATLQGSWLNALWIHFWLNILRISVFYVHISFVIAHIYIYITRMNHLEFWGWVDPSESYNYLFGDLSTRSWMDYFFDWFINFFKHFVDYGYYQKKHDDFFENRSIWAETVARDIVQACENDRHMLRVRRWEIMHQLRADGESRSRLRLILYYVTHKC